MNGKLKVVVAIVVVLVVLNVAKNMIVQAAICAGASKAAKVPVKIGSTRFSFLASSIDLRDLRVENPRGFPEKLMIHAPQVKIDVEPMDLFKGIAHFEEASLNLKEVIVVKNREGKLNIDAVKPTPEEKQADKERAAETKKTAGKKTKLQIDKLSLTIGRVVYKDYSSGGKEPNVQVFDVNIKDRVYTNIDNPTAIVRIIMFEALTRTTLSRLAGLDVGIFKDGALGAVSGGLGVVSDGTQAVENQTKKVLSLFD